MSTAGEILLLAFGVFAVLAALTGLGEFARWRSRGRPNPVLETYRTRVNSWWVMVTLICLALLSGRTGIILLTAFASFAALREFLTLTTKDQADHWALVFAFYLILPAQYVFVWMHWDGLYSIFIPVLAFLFLPLVSALRGDARRYLVRVSETQWALMICVFCVSHLAALTMLDIPGYEDRAVLLVAFLVMVVQFGDLLEYWFGRRIGRTRIAPGLSPKTWEGVIAGLASASLIGLLLSWITPFGPGGAMAMALAISAIGMCGNLVITAIKHDRGVRDWSHLIPGQGGVVDQLDSVIFAAPAFYYLTKLIWLS
jgi:phosphatidate cytidylyltransferase